MTPLPPLRREILVAADPDTAFEVFTAGIGRWWPIPELSVHGAGGSVAFIDGEIVEHSVQGERALWGTVTRWEPGAAVAFSWHPARAPERASSVLVTFTAAGAETLVTLEHSGWEVFDDPAQARTEYGNGWPTVLAGYRDACQGADAGTAA